MVWAAAKATRARRLCDTTHALAERALSGEHGRAMAPATFGLTQAEQAGYSAEMRCALAIRRIAEQAPLRILPGERIVGSATLREATLHQVPVAGIASTSHTTPGFGRALAMGYAGLRAQVGERLSRPGLDGRGRDLLEAMRVCLDAAGIWHRRHMELLTELAARSEGTERAEYEAVRAHLARVPECPPEGFREAVQSLWFLFAFQRLCGNWPGIGRIDEMLGPYLERDLAEGRLTLDEAREILAHFWIKGCEWTGASDFGGSGDAQYYQNVVLAGVDAEGHEVTNAVTYLVLDIVEELHISDFPIAVRLNARSPERLLRRVAEVMRHGGGIVAVYNEDVVIEALTRFGYGLAEARTFANDGCWEVLIPGRTAFSYNPFDALALLQGALGLDGDGVLDYPSFEALYAAFVLRLEAALEAHHEAADGFAANGHPSALLSLLVEDCIERGRGYHDRGARYTVLAPHAGGLANVCDSLLAVKRLVYDEGLVTLDELVAILRDDWEGHEALRQRVLNEFTAYGNDGDEADAMMVRVFDDYTRIAGRVRERNGVLRPAGISTFGREIAWSQPGGRAASPDGHRRGAVLATNFSPSPGADREGPTAVIRSVCKMDFTRLPNGTAFELKVLPDCVGGEAGIETLVALMRTFVQLGGWFVQVDVVDSAMLRDAQRHPERYRNLSVRVSGWSARFATLNKEWQDMIIQRTQQMMR
ncbi:MAG TPA: pyruvate formate lyase family protein [Armatimonadota bacterium]|nr:pyruvate formate lyase family protein [Armatimonadota bacterium]